MSIKKIINKYKNIIYLGIIIIILTMPYLQIDGIVPGHDLFYHVDRINGVAESMRNGEFFPKILPGFYDNYGYAAPLFYSNFFIWIFGLLTYFGLNVISSYKLMLCLINIVTIFSMYYFTDKLVKNKCISLFATTIYSLSIYRCFTDAIFRAALGEFIAFIFIPMFFYSVLDIVYNGSKQYFWLVISMSCLILCHTLSAFMSFLLLLVICLVNIKNVLNKETILTFLKAGIMTILLCSFYLIPMLEMMVSDVYKYSDPWAFVDENALQEISKIFIYKLNFDGGRFPFGIEFVTFVLSVLSVFLFRDYKKNKMLIHLTVFGWMCIILSTNIVPWNFLKNFLNIIQFPWRFFEFGVYFLSICVPMTLYKILKSKQYYKYLMIAILFLYSTNYLNYSFTYKRNLNNTFMEFPGYTNFYALGDFLPIDANMEKIQERGHIVTCDNPIELNYKSGYLKYVVCFNQNEKNGSKLEVPLIWYKGYNAILNKKDILEVEKSENGLLEINLGKTKKGEIEVYYEGTFIQEYSKIISISVIVLYMVKRMIQNQRNEFNKKRQYN